MQDLTYDLHIHSCLSPCGDNDSTPGNIAGMAAVKGLDVVALTDHNTSRNCPAFLAAAEAYGVLAIPGMELTTEEEVHAVCLFPELKAALDFDSYVYDKLMKFPNKPAIFGDQLIYGLNDTVIDTEPNLLINACSISFDDVYSLVESYGGVMFPAHIDKDTTSLLSNLGFIPPYSEFKTAEVKDLSKLPALKEAHPYLNNCMILNDSDAHYLEHIHEPSFTISVEERSAVGVIEAIRKGLE